MSANGESQSIEATPAETPQLALPVGRRPRLPTLPVEDPLPEAPDVQEPETVEDAEVEAEAEAEPEDEAPAPPDPREVERRSPPPVLVPALPAAVAVRVPPELAGALERGAER